MLPKQIRQARTAAADAEPEREQQAAECQDGESRRRSRPTRPSPISCNCAPALTIPRHGR